MVKSPSLPTVRHSIQLPGNHIAAISSAGDQRNRPPPALGVL
jgi:hypothetical protein